MGQTTEASLEGDTFFAEPKGFMWYLALSCSVLQRLIYGHRQQQRFRHSGDSTDRDIETRGPLTEGVWMKPVLGQDTSCGLKATIRGIFLFVDSFFYSI